MATTAASRPAAPRSSTTSPGSPKPTPFPGLKAIGKVTAGREQDGRTTTATRYYLLSKPLSAARFLEVVRSHWQIENRLHWVLDVVLDEDLARARKDHAPENLARLRRFALNLLRANQDNGSTRGKIKRAAWDDALLNLLASA
jgi:predicted transposase YbfD/YdcC